MSRDVVLKQVDAALAQVGVLQVQLQTIRHCLTETPKPTARPALAERCKGIESGKCALQSVDAALSKASFGDPHAWTCAGCRFEGSGAAM